MPNTGVEDGPNLLLPSQQENLTTRSQNVVSSVELQISNGTLTNMKQPSISHHQSLILPSKPTHLPPPVPSSEINSAILDSAACALLPPEKPPRTTIRSTASEEKKSTDVGKVNNDSCKDGKKEQHEQQHTDASHQPDVRMRCTRGWQEEMDEEGNRLFTHPSSKDQWVKVNGDDGQSYFYEKSSRQSSWDLPLVELQDAAPLSTFCKRPAGTITEVPSAPVSCITFNSINTIDLTEAQAKFGARRISASKSGSGLSTLSTQGESSSRFYRISKDHITGPIENKIRATERRGQVNFTQVTENGVRVPKKWIPSYLFLIGPTLCVYKDSKGQPAASATHTSKASGAVSPKFAIKASDSGAKIFNFHSKSSSISGKLELKVHVKHLQICPNVKNYTSRENVFVLKDSTQPDNVAEYLIEVPSAELRRAWETAIQYSQDFDKEDRFDPTAFSTNPPPSVDQRIIAMLRDFFRRRPTLESIRERGILQNEPVFGSNLIELCQKEQTKVPTFVTRVIHAVEARGLETNGLYRQSGNGATIQKLRIKVNHSEYSLNSDEWDIYELSDSLKLFLRELKEPLFLYDVYDDFKEFTSSIPSHSIDQNVNSMRVILDKLPDCHYATAKLIFEHLSKVAALESVNQMSAKNLALVFGPNLMWGGTTTDDYIRFPVVGCVCTEFAITNSAAVFASPLRQTVLLSKRQ